MDAISLTYLKGTHLNNLSSNSRLSRSLPSILLMKTTMISISQGSKVRKTTIQIINSSKLSSSKISTEHAVPYNSCTTRTQDTAVI
jgi:hypothetical protein